MDRADRAILLGGLSRTLREAGLEPQSLDLLPDSVHSRSGSYPSETAICRLQSSEILRLFCKCSKGFDAPTHQHRSGVAYEAEVYRSLVSSFEGTSPSFIGAFENTPRKLVFLVLEELQDVLRVSKTTVENMARAAAWIARFHAVHEAGGNGTRPPFLTVYDLAYYRQWPRRAFRLTRDLHSRYPWLRRICDAFEKDLAPTLLRAPQTVIHGEFYPKNVLARGETVYPVDWESTAVAPGELDLVSLTEGWSAHDKDLCSRAYVRTRWPDGRPRHFEATRQAAEVYWLLRWLGNGSYFATGKHGVRRLDDLGRLGREMGLIRSGAWRR